MKTTELKLETHCLKQIMNFYSNVLGFKLLDATEEAFSVQAGFTIKEEEQTLQAVTALMQHLDN